MGVAMLVGIATTGRLTIVVGVAMAVDVLTNVVLAPTPLAGFVP